MNENAYAFNWYHMFWGDAPLMYLLEIVLRTFVLYAYTVFLLRLMGKRGMGQLSVMEVAIIIAFGSAVGDPMLHDDTPIIHGVVVITAITLLQIIIERFVNKNRKAEKLMEGEAQVIIDEGVVLIDTMIKNNISKDDLFRMLRQKNVEHLGQIKKAIFETNGHMSVIMQEPDQVKAGLRIVPAKPVEQGNLFVCNNCHAVQAFEEKPHAGHPCLVCGSAAWVVDGGQLR